MKKHIKKPTNNVIICISTILMLTFFAALDALIIINAKNIEKILSQNFDAVTLGNRKINISQMADIYDQIVTNTTNAKNIKNNKEKWIIEIPKLNLLAPIKEGTSQEVLADAVGHFEESKKYEGNGALAGHNRGYNCDFFKEIKELKNGDKIIYYTNKGKKEYKVILNKIIHQADWSYIENTKDNRITLITCVENMHEYRRCIQAIEVI